MQKWSPADYHSAPFQSCYEKDGHFTWDQQGSFHDSAIRPDGTRFGLRIEYDGVPVL